MAGIFGFFDFTRPGKGINPDDPEKRALFRFLDILWHKKGKLIAMNIMYFICVLPIVLAFHVLLYNYIDTLLEENEYIGSLFLMFFSFIGNINTLILLIILIISVFLLGPATCGLTYMLRNFVRSEHAWISDFWQRAKENLKQGLFLGILDVVMFYIGFYNIFLLVDPDSEISSFFVIAALVAFVLYLCMRNTLYLMAVSVELTNFALIRNAVILTFDGFWRHLLTGLIYAFYIFLIFLINPFVELIVLPFLGFSLLGLTSVFICYPIVDKRLIQPQLNSAEKDAGEQI